MTYISKMNRLRNYIVPFQRPCFDYLNDRQENKVFSLKKVFRNSYQSNFVKDLGYSATVAGATTIFYTPYSNLHKTTTNVFSDMKTNIRKHGFLIWRGALANGSIFFSNDCLVFCLRGLGESIFGQSHSFLTGGFAGVFELLFYHHYEVLKSSGLRGLRGYVKQFSFGGLKGLRGLHRYYLFSAFGMFIRRGVQFGTFYSISEELKDSWNLGYYVEDILIGSGIVVGTFVGEAIYLPFRTVRGRLLDSLADPKSKTVRNCIRLMYAEKGFGAFVFGWRPLYSAFLSSSIAFGAFYILKSRNDRDPDLKSYS